MVKLIKGLLLVLLSYSCEKKPKEDDGTIVFGKVVDAKTNEPIENVQIVKVSYCTYSRNDTTVLARTDKEGKFEGKLNLSDTYGTYNSRDCGDDVKAHCPGYADSDLSLKVGAINECNVKLVKNAFLKIYLKNVNPCNLSDECGFSISSNGTLSPFNWSFSPANTLDTTLIINILPNFVHTIYWGSLKCGITNQNKEDVYFTSGDTIYRSIFY